MKTYKMYGGDQARTPDLPANAAAPEGVTYDVTSAKECYEIIMRCKEEGRFAGEYAKAVSFFSEDSVLLNVIHECASMEDYTVHKDSVGDWMMVGRTGYVVGFVHKANRDTGRDEQYFGIAFIGG